MIVRAQRADVENNMATYTEAERIEAQKTLREARNGAQYRGPFMVNAGPTSPFPVRRDSYIADQPNEPRHKGDFDTDGKLWQVNDSPPHFKPTRTAKKGAVDGKPAEVVGKTGDSVKDVPGFTERVNPKSTLWHLLFEQGAGEYKTTEKQGSLHCIMPSAKTPSGAYVDTGVAPRGDGEDEGDYRVHLNRLSDAASNAAAADDDETSNFHMQRCCEHLQNAAKAYRAMKGKEHNTAPHLQEDGSAEMLHSAMPWKCTSCGWRSAKFEDKCAAPNCTRGH
jgi:hypothetical protein